MAKKTTTAKLTVSYIMWGKNRGFWYHTAHGHTRCVDLEEARRYAKSRGLAGIQVVCAGKGFNLSGKVKKAQIETEAATETEG